MDDKNFYPHFSQAEFARRYAVVRAAMQEADLPALLVYGMPSMSSEVQYLSNYATTREAFLIFPAEPELEPALFAQMYNHIPTARIVSCVSDVHGGGANTAETTVENVKKRGFAEGRIGLVGAIDLLLAAAHAQEFQPHGFQIRGAGFQARCIDKLEVFQLATLLRNHVVADTRIARRLGALGAGAKYGGGRHDDGGGEGEAFHGQILHK